MKKLILPLVLAVLFQSSLRAVDPPTNSQPVPSASVLETIDIESAERTVVLQTPEHIEAPNWSPDGLSLIVNQGGLLYRVPVQGGELQRIDTGFARHCNNDHGISPDGTLLAISDSTRPGGSQVYTLPITGGEPQPATQAGAGSSFWHGWSPDGRTLAFVGERDGDNDIYAVPVTGGKEVRLTTSPGKDDGPDYSPDGRHLFYNSYQTGRMQIWRIDADGGNPTQFTFDAYSNWFPHPSPDGKWIAYLSYVEDQGDAHPPNKEVLLQLMPAAGGKPRTLARFTGGQGTINVPSWSPDSRRFAFVSYPSSQAVGATLPRSTPEAQGVSSQALLDFVTTLDRTVNTAHSFMVVRHGFVVAEGWWKPEAAEKSHILMSLSKSFTSTAVGLAIEEGKLRLDDPVLKFFPDDAPPEPSENLRAMTVRDLLTMTGGHDTEAKAPRGAPTVKLFLAHPVVHKPGTHFQYNTPGTYTLSAIVTKVTGQTVLDYLKPRLFEPLGIAHPEWDQSPEGYSLGGYGLHLRTEDIAKFGQLYLQKGAWKGKQLIPVDWVEQATSKQVPNDQEGHAKAGPDWQQGYGFQFWRCTHDAYRGDGAGGQFCVVLPEQDAVVALTAQTDDMQGELAVVWEKLLPGLQAKELPGDPATQAKLRMATSNLEAHPTKKQE